MKTTTFALLLFAGPEVAQGQEAPQQSENIVMYADGGALRDTPSYTASTVARIEPGQTFTVIDEKSNPSFALVEFKGTKGYLLRFIIEKCREAAKKPDAPVPMAGVLAEITKKRQAAREKVAGERRARLIKKYGKELGGKIAEGKVWIGMPAEQAKDSWGEPEEINRTTTAHGTREQWVYSSGNYLYVEDGIVTAIQN